MCQCFHLQASFACSINSFTIQGAAMMVRSLPKNSNNKIRGAPSSSFSDPPHLYTPSLQLHSSTDTRVFRILSFRAWSSGQCSFSFQATATWNQVPVFVHRAYLCQFLQIFFGNFLFLKILFFSPIVEYNSRLCRVSLST